MLFYLVYQQIPYPTVYHLQAKDHHVLLELSVLEQYISRNCAGVDSENSQYCSPLAISKSYYATNSISQYRIFTRTNLTDQLQSMGDHEPIIVLVQENPKRPIGHPQ